MTYKECISKKRLEITNSGFNIAAEALNPALFDWQKDITRWALRKGKAALLEDCGLGK